MPTERMPHRVVPDFARHAEEDSDGLRWVAPLLCQNYSTCSGGLPASLHCCHPKGGGSDGSDWDAD